MPNFFSVILHYLYPILVDVIIGLFYYDYKRFRLSLVYGLSALIKCLLRVYASWW